MKNRYFRFGLSTLGLFLAFLSFAIGQDAEQREILLQFSDQQAQKSKDQKAYAMQFADSVGIPVRIVNDGKTLELQFVENGIPFYYITHNFEGAQTLKSSEVWPGGAAGYNLTGSGQTMGMWDSGAILLSHQELTERVLQVDDATDFSNHATHVAATMIASGFQEAAKGMSYQAKLNAYDWNNDNAEMAAAAAQGLKVSQHSYGFVTGWRWNGDDWEWWGNTSISQTEDYRFGFYDQNARQWDIIANNAPNYLIVKSAGNDRGYGPPAGTEHYVWENGEWVLSTEIRQVDGGINGYDCISSTGNAKNILTVGAVTASGQMTSFSGWGPTDDGRVKPDIVAKGVGVYSATATSDTSYETWNGTSMSGPMVSGSVGLLLQHQQDLHGPDKVLKSATLKGLILHTATQMDNHPGPDYRNGWGMMNTRSVVDLMTENALAGEQFNIREFNLVNGQNIQIEVISDGTSPLKATIVWNDPAAVVSAAALNSTTPKLVNDLDMRITAPGNNVFYPWTLNPANPEHIATTGDNFRDNVEQVFIQNPIAGQNYVINVSHKGTLAGGNQPFSLIISGITQESDIRNVVFYVKDKFNYPIQNAAINIVSQKGNSSNFDTVVNENTLGLEYFTNINGQVQIPSTPGTYNFTVTKDGYLPYSNNFTLVENEIVVNVFLFVDDEPLDMNVLSLLSNPSIGGNNSGGGNYHQGAEVALLAIPSTGYAFVNWTDQDQNVVSPHAFFNYIMPDASVILTANFESIPLYRLNLAVNPAGAALVTGEGDFYAGSQVALNTFTNIGYLFVNWTDSLGNVVSLQPAFVFKMPDGNTTLTANFVSIPFYSLSVSVNPPDAGNVSGAGDFLAGESITLSATPDAAYNFLSWTTEGGSILGIQKELDFIMPANDVHINANFEHRKYNLTLSIVGEGEVWINNEIYTHRKVFLHGDTVLIEANPADNWYFAGWFGDLTSTVSIETFVMTSSMNIMATFAPDPLYTLSLITNPVFGGTVSGGGNFLEGAIASLVAIPADGFRFLRWSDIYGNEIDTMASFLYTMPALGTALIANFEQLVGYSNLTIPMVSVYPNPAKDEIYLHAEHPISSIIIFDVAGRIIKREDPDNTDVRLSVQDLSAGLYLLNIMIDNNLITRRLIIYN